MPSSKAAPAELPSPEPPMQAPPPMDVALSYWVNLSHLIDSVAVTPERTTSPTTAAETDTIAKGAFKDMIYTRYSLQGILLFCGIKQHRVQQTVDQMIAQMLSVTLTPSQATSTACALWTLWNHESNQPGDRRPASLPVLIKDWLLLSAADAKAGASRRHRHRKHFQLQLTSVTWERAIIKALGKELRGQMICLRPLLRWNMACAQQSGRTPVVILIGGTSGSGKSTLARLVASQLRIANVLSTDTVRQVLRARLAGRETDHPALFVSTYEAHKALSDATTEPQPADVVKGYESQCALVLQVLDGVLRRLVARGESVVVEGVHLLPKYLAAKRVELLVKTVICVPVLVQIPKADGHLERFCVRSRGMSLQSNNNKYIASFQAIRAIQNHLVTTVEAEAMPVLVLTNTNVDKSFLVLHHAVLETMEYTALHGWPVDTAASAQVPLTALAFTATKRKLVAVVRQRRTHKSTTNSSSGGEIEGGAAATTAAAASSTGSSCGGGGLGSFMSGAVAASSRARSAELLGSVDRRLPEPGPHYSTRQSGAAAHADSGSSRLHPSYVRLGEGNPTEETSPSSFLAYVRRNSAQSSPTTSAAAPIGLQRSLVAADESNPFRAAPPRRSTTTSVLQSSSLGARVAFRDNEEAFDEAEVPSLMGS